VHIKGRGEGRKQPVRKVLIVCEGEQTEPNYFRAFRVASHVCNIQGTGCNTLSLVKEAVRLSQMEDYREVWCVFDRDSFREKHVRAAYSLAEEKGFKIAYSNECFELWYLLHFKYLDTALRREEYYRQLRGEMGKYAKNSVDMYDFLMHKQSTAIKHAERLDKGYGPHPDRCNCTPYTSVHLLVKRLNALAAKMQ
jgi:hypothetical protein